jgi:hypothetical protein
MADNTSQQISLDDIKLFRKATGCPISQCASSLNSMDSVLRERILLAAKLQHGLLRDPIETEPAYSQAVTIAREEATATMKAQGFFKQRGSSHKIYVEQARILRERFNILWFSPHEMNPFVIFE